MQFYVHTDVHSRLNYLGLTVDIDRTIDNGIEKKERNEVNIGVWCDTSTTTTTTTLFDLLLAA